MTEANSLQAILFDVDGTIAETEQAHRAAFNRAFIEFGILWNWNDKLYGELLSVTGGKERIGYFVDAYDTVPKLSPGDIVSLHKRKTEIFAGAVAEGAVGLRPGVERLWRLAREANIKVGIATTTSKANVAALLSATIGEGWELIFDVVAAGDIVPEKKPAPDIYLLALERLGIDARNVVAIEDSDNGLRSALGAEIATLITPSSYTLGQDFTGASAVVDTLGDQAVATKVISGPELGARFVDLDYLSRLLAD